VNAEHPEKASIVLRGAEEHPGWRLVFLLGTVVLTGHLARLGQPSRVGAAILLALAPFGAILLLVALLQSHDKRPAPSRRWAILWGALVAAGGSAYANGLLGSRPDWQTIVVTAPLIEETLKIAGMLLLLHWGRIRRPLDGVIYALLVGGGFAFAENVLYFFNAINAEIAGDDGVLRSVFLVRGIVSPLAHPVFVGVAGVCMAAPAARRGVSIAVGAAGGISLHALWNHAALRGLIDPLAFYVSALSLALVVVMLLFARRERIVRDAPDTAARHEDCRSGEVPEDWSRPLPWY
jgi:RsiW-degrading membrane proteinase PrsW (M82 family)